MWKHVYNHPALLAQGNTMDVVRYLFHCKHVVIPSSWEPCHRVVFFFCFKLVSTQAPPPQIHPGALDVHASPNPIHSTRDRPTPTGLQEDIMREIAA